MKRRDFARDKALTDEIGYLVQMLKTDQLNKNQIDQLERRLSHCLDELNVIIGIEPGIEVRAS